MSKYKQLSDKIEKALRYKRSHFTLVQDDDKTVLNRSDLQLILNLLNK